MKRYDVFVDMVDCEDGEWVRYDEAAAEIERLRAALDDVCRHQETVAPGAYRLSTTWHIAASALGKANAAGGSNE